MLHLCCCGPFPSRTLYIYKKRVSLHGAKLGSRDILPLRPTSTNGIRTLNDDELNIVLHKLVEYLGHSNPIVTGVAFNEVGLRSLLVLSTDMYRS